MKRLFSSVMYKVVFCIMAVAMVACQLQPRSAKVKPEAESPVLMADTSQSGSSNRQTVVVVSGQPGEDEWHVPSVDRIWAEAYDLVEEMPYFPGGYDSLQHYLYRHLCYPPQAVEKGVEGRIIVRFVVMPDGSISSVYADDSVGEADPCLEEEAVRLVGSMPRWMPGRHQGKEVAVRCVLPIVFKLP